MESQVWIKVGKTYASVFVVVVFYSYVFREGEGGGPFFAVKLYQHSGMGNGNLLTL